MMVFFKLPFDKNIIPKGYLKLSIVHCQLSIGREPNNSRFAEASSFHAFCIIHFIRLRKKGSGENFKKSLQLL